MSMLSRRSWMVCWSLKKTDSALQSSRSYRAALRKGGSTAKFCINSRLVPLRFVISVGVVHVRKSVMVGTGLVAAE